ncbi:MAG: hypothetical protein ACLFNQ_03305, partial [Spirochaetaceae bacterium]
SAGPPTSGHGVLQLKRIGTKVLMLVVILHLFPGALLVLIVRHRLAAVVQAQTFDIASQFMRRNAGYLELYLDEIENTVRYISDMSVVQESIRAPAFEACFEC